MKRFALFATSAVFLAVACSDSTSPPTPTTIVLSAATVSLDAIGATQTITATVSDQHGQPMPSATVTWSASTAAATVAPVAATPGSAVITAALNGASTITASAGSAHAAVNVVVAQAPAALQKVSGDAQSGTVNQLLASAISARVVDRLGIPVAGQTVTFAVTQGGGALTQASVTTSSDGTAATTWTLGHVVTDAQQVSATVGSLAPVSFTATAIAGAPASLAIVAGNGQTGSVGTSLAVVPQVVVKDAFGNLVNNAAVTFTATGGSVAFPSATSNAAGIATPGQWTLGTTPGTKTLGASASGTNTVSFSATAVVGPPATMTITGNNQTAAAGASVATAPSARIVDAFANPVSGLGVVFSVTSGGGSVTGGSTTTDANGVATVGSWTLGSSSGQNTLSVTPATSAIAAQTVTATATGGATPPGASGAITITNGGNQAVMAGQSVPLVPTVAVTDVAGHPAAGVTVTFTIASGGGSVTGATATTNASGVASVGGWTIGPLAALNTMTATATGFSTATFSAAGCEGGGTGYAITVCYRSTMTASQRQAFVDAAAKWKSVVTSDLPDLTVSIGEQQCDAGTPSINMTIDDLLVFASVEPIDGAGRILGSAGWCFKRTAAPGLPIVGSMRFDVADVVGLEASNRFGAVILHEMGHVLGIGSLWSTKGFLQNPSGATPFDTYFSGPSGIAGFDAIGGTTYTGGQKVPVENTGGAGTANAHWRESVLANELMTGFLNSGSNPLSLLTVRSLEDLGYTVNTAAADPFFLTLSLQALRVPDPGAISLAGDVFTGHQATIDRAGKITRIR